MAYYDIHIVKYSKGRSLGTGSFGQVFEFLIRDDSNISANTPERLAVKKIRFEEPLSEQAERMWNRELRILLRTDHPNVVKLYGYWRKPLQFRLALELCTCNLQKFISRRNRWTKTLKQVRPLAKQITDGMVYLHDNHIIHRDIKQDNILMKYNEAIDPYDNLDRITIKITDFGLSRVLAEDASSISIVGAKLFHSPEEAFAMNQNEKFRPTYPTAADVFSVCTLFFFMRFRQFAFSELELMSRQINVDAIHQWNEEPDANFKDLCRKMWAVNPQQRIAMQQVQEHAFFN